MTDTVNSFLKRLSAKELHDLFIKESEQFLTLLSQNPTSDELERVKERIKLIMDTLNEKKAADG